MLAFLSPRVAQQVMAANADRYARQTWPQHFRKHEHGQNPGLYLSDERCTVKGTRVVAVPILDVSGVRSRRSASLPFDYRLPVRPNSMPLLNTLNGCCQRDFGSAAGNRSEPHAPKAWPFVNSVKAFNAYAEVRLIHFVCERPQNLVARAERI